MIGVMAYQDIIEMIDLSPDVIKGADRGQVKSASYDLRLGSNYYLYNESFAKNGENKISVVNENDLQRVVVPAHQAVYVTMRESLSLPKDVVGHLSLKFDLTLKGLIMSAQSQIDAGYAGNVFALLFNLSENDVSVNVNDSVLRLELVRLHSGTDKPYGGRFSEKKLQDILLGPVNSSTAALRKEVCYSNKRINKKINNYGLIGLSVTAIFTFAAIVVPVMISSYGPIAKNSADISRISAELPVFKEKFKSVDEIYFHSNSEFERIKIEIDNLKSPSYLKNVILDLNGGVEVKHGQKEWYQVFERVSKIERNNIDFSNYVLEVVVDLKNENIALSKAVAGLVARNGLDDEVSFLKEQIDHNRLRIESLEQHIKFMNVK